MTVWQAGMRCVFVREYELFPAGTDFVFPVKGRVYTVRDVVVSTLGPAELGLRLHEISNAHTIGRVIPYDGRIVTITGEPVFEASRFRPLSEARLDQFRKLLAPLERSPA